MIDTVMALWNRGHRRGKQVLFTFCALLLVCISISLLVITVGRFWPHRDGPSVSPVGLVTSTESAVTSGTMTPTAVVIQNCLPSPTATARKVATTYSHVPTQTTGQGQGPQPAPTPLPRREPSPTPRPAFTPTPVATHPPVPTSTAIPTPIPVPTQLPTPTSTPIAVSPTPTAGLPTPTPIVVSPTPTVASTPSPVPTVTITATVMPTSTATGTVTSTPTVTPMLSPTPTLVAGSPTPGATVTATTTAPANRPQSASSGGGGGTPGAAQDTPGAGTGWVTNCGSDALSTAGMMADGAIILSYLPLLVVMALLGTLLFYAIVYAIKRQE